MRHRTACARVTARRVPAMTVMRAHRLRRQSVPAPQHTSDVCEGYFEPGRVDGRAGGGDEHPGLAGGGGGAADVAGGGPGEGATDGNGGQVRLLADAVDRDAAVARQRHQEPDAAALGRQGVPDGDFLAALLPEGAAGDLPAGDRPLGGGGRVDMADGHDAQAGGDGPHHGGG
eukprot:7382975-Prymnesium_polylepis.1